MTAVVHQSIKNVHALAQRLNKVASPFFFLKNNMSQFSNLDSKVTIKVNRQMTQFFDNLPSSSRLAFWSSIQFESQSINKEILENSIIVNPFKTQRLIRSALAKGISKMVVGDVEELVKIQECYFKLTKDGCTVKHPEYIWAIENSESDLENLKDIKQCDLPINGFCFSSDMTVKQVQKVLEFGSIYHKGKQLLKLKQSTIKDVKGLDKLARDYGVEPMVTDFSETQNYTMVCRIIGKDRNSHPIFDESCLDFICKLESCNCQLPKPKIQSFVEIDGNQWAVLNPLRLDRLQKDHILP